MQSFTEAILSLFDELNNLLTERGLPQGAVRAYLFGGCAAGWRRWTLRTF
jgi:hypothetical protein